VFPQFLCIGAKHAGTTWLYANLRTIPQVWMPPVKELRYFEPIRKGRASRIKAGLDGYRRSLTYVRRRWQTGELSVIRDSLRWHLAFLLLPRTDRWYGNLFPNEPGTISGDISPAYARLDRAAVQHVRELMPGCRIIFILRNPAERAWSETARILRRHERADRSKISDDAAEAACKKPICVLNSDYLATLKLWEDAFPAGQIHVSFYDQLHDEPQQFFEDICHFIGVRSPGTGSAISLRHEVVNPGRLPPMPDSIRPRLARFYGAKIRALEDRFHNPYTARWMAWLAEAERG
jgi:hypothetical protein